MCLLQNIRPALKRSVLLFTAGFVLLGFIPGTVNAKSLPFKEGEKITYRVSWGVIPAADVWLTVKGVSKLEGKKAWHFVMEGASKRYVDLFYKIRARFDSFTDEDFNHSLFYKVNQEGKENKKEVARFDWGKKQVHYSNFGKEREPVDIPENTFDPLASFYKLRSLNFKAAAPGEDKNLHFPVTDGKKCFIQKGEMIRKERISLSTKTYDTYLIAPHVDNFSGVFKKSKDPTVKVWLSADERQIPVRIVIKVFIGHVIFELLDPL